MHISGTIRIADGGEPCDANRAGAIRYTGGNLSFCNGSVWSILGASGGTVSDRITSGTTSIVAQQGGVISITTNGSTANYWDTAGRLITPGISITTLNGISSTNGKFWGVVRIDNREDSDYSLIMRDSAGNVEHSFEPGKALLSRDGGGVGVGTTIFNATLHVSGTIMAKTAATDRDCTPDQDGAIRYNSVTKRLQICR